MASCITFSKIAKKQSGWMTLSQNRQTVNPSKEFQWRHFDCCVCLHFLASSEGALLSVLLITITRLADDAMLTSIMIFSMYS